MSDAPNPPPPAAGIPVPPATARPAKAERLRELYDDDEDDRRPRRPRPAAGWPARSEGVLPRAKVRLACFVVLTLALVAAGALCILAVWDAAPSDVAWKGITTLGIVAAMAAGFTVLNEVFGRPADQDEG